MAATRSSALLVSIVLLVWALVAQLMSPLGFWFFITRGEILILVLGIAFGAGVLGVIGIPFVVAALVMALQGHVRKAGLVALVGGIVSAISIVAVAAALFALFSPEGRAEEQAPTQLMDGPAVG